MKHGTSRKRILIFALLGALSIAPSSTGAEGDPNPLVPPKVVITGLSFQLDLKSVGVESADFLLEITKDGKTVLTRSGTLPQSFTDLVLENSGVHNVIVRSGDQTWESSIRAFPGVFTVMPPVLAIVMALIFRQVVIALFAGIWLGAFFVTDLQLGRSFYYVIDYYVVDSLAGDNGWEHIQIAIFTLLLGGMVGVFTRIGGTRGVVNKISRIATTPRRGQLATWLMGIAVFFDDYTNTLIVGNTMRAITDRLRISREKLSYIVDSTAAPVACIAVVTSWIGFEISLVKDAFDSLEIDRNPFTTFVASIQYSFYPILTLVFGLLIAATSRDFGPMLKAEQRARNKGQLLADKAVPLSSIDRDVMIDESTSPRWYNAAIPIFVVVMGTFIGLVATGRTSLIDSGVINYTLMDTIRESNSFDALLWSSLSGCVTAIVLGLVQRLASLTAIMDACVAGIKSMVAALIILVLAWCIGSVCTDLQTANYLVAKVSGFLDPKMLPTIVFLIAAAISFSTGTSWGTMTILTPITIPLVIRISEINAVTGGAHEAILLSSIAAILAGAVFGDHCSPISDTTIMSSMASGADHVDHVRTQLPYAVVVAIIAILFGYLPSGFNLPSWVSLIVAVAVIVGAVVGLGKHESSYSSRIETSPGESEPAN